MTVENSELSKSGNGGTMQNGKQNCFFGGGEIMAERTKENAGRKRTVAWVLISISMIIVLSVGFIYVTQIGHENGPSEGDTQIGNQAEAVISDSNLSENEDKNTTEGNGTEMITMSTYGIEVKGNSLSSAVAMSETENAWAGTPAFVFVGKRKEETNTDSSALAVGELLEAAAQASQQWDYESIPTDFLASCQCVPSDDYVIIIADDRYSPLAVIFEQATSDPTVLDMEDLIERLKNFEVEGDQTKDSSAAQN